MRIHGSCHCGNIRFDLDWPAASTGIPARACTCSFCMKHGGVWTAHPEATLQIVIANAGEVGTYRFETATADFHVCKRCGAVPVVTSRIEGRLHAVVSVNAFDDFDRSMLQHAMASFDGEAERARLARRQRNWIGKVVFGPSTIDDLQQSAG